MARNNTLEEKLASASTETPVSESKDGTKLDGERKPSDQPKTTRRTLTESQKAGKQTLKEEAQPDDEIGVIAAGLDELP